MERVHVFFVDGHPAVRAAVQKLIERSGAKVTTFGSAEECLSTMRRQTCDIVIADIRLTGTDGISLVQHLHHRFPWLPILAVTVYGDTSTVMRALKAGASDFTDEPLDPQELLTSMEKPLRAWKRLDPAIRESLSESETKVLRLILDGKTCKEIGDSSHRSIRTIESHRHRIMQKLGAKNIAQLIQRAYELGYNPSPQGRPDPVAALNEA